jgi:hypothetical protein
MSRNKYARDIVAADDFVNWMGGHLSERASKEKVFTHFFLKERIITLIEPDCSTLTQFAF